MNYCLDFNKYSKYLNEVAEIRINFEKQKIDAIDYIIQHPDQIIILNINNIESFIKDKYMNKLSDIYINSSQNFKVEFNIYDENYIKDIQAAAFPFFFNIYPKDWDMIVGFAELGVSDIYITEALGFDLVNIANYLHSKNIKIRCFPNIAQSSWKESNKLKTFFIRPEDIDFYSDYIDVCEFLGKQNKVDIYYEIYNHDKKWTGELKELIIGFDNDLNSKFTIPRFAERRIGCEKKCLKNKRCSMCDTIYNLSKTLEENHLIVKKEEN